MEFKMIKEYFTNRIVILKISALETLMTQFNYFLSNLFELSFGILFSIFSIFYLDALFGNVNQIAGYSKNEMLFFTFVGQICFSTIINFSSSNIEELIRSVRSGQLDLVLTKPLPSLFYVSLKRIDLIMYFRGVFTATLPYIFVISWQSLNLQLINVVTGILIASLGLFCLHVFQFLCGLSVFFKGSGTELLSLNWAFEYNLGRSIPFEGIDKTFRIIFTTLIPVMISTGMSASIMLGKIDKSILFIVIGITIVCYIVKDLMWKLALKNYSSVS